MFFSQRNFSSVTLLLLSFVFNFDATFPAPDNFTKNADNGGLQEMRTSRYQQLQRRQVKEKIINDNVEGQQIENIGEQSLSSSNIVQKATTTTVATKETTAATEETITITEETTAATEETTKTTEEPDTVTTSTSNSTKTTTNTPIKTSSSPSSQPAVDDSDIFYPRLLVASVFAVFSFILLLLFMFSCCGVMCASIEEVEL